MAELSEIVSELQALQRRRADVIKSRIMQTNHLQAAIARTLGYHSGLSKEERTVKFGEATAIIKAVEAEEMESPSAPFILSISTSIQGLNDYEALLKKGMAKFAAQLPVAVWVAQPDQRGFGLLMLATVIGETGDLAGYSCPGKLWKRMGCTTYKHDGKQLMGSTWRKKYQGSLPAEDWAKFGYSPRRRSIAFLIGDCLLKGNAVRVRGEDDCAFVTDESNTSPRRARRRSAGDKRTGESPGVTDAPSTGPYRSHYDAARAAFAAKHPDSPPMRHHRHGMLMMTKKLLLELWRAWNGNPPDKELWRKHVNDPEAA